MISLFLVSIILNYIIIILNYIIIFGIEIIYFFNTRKNLYDHYIQRPNHGYEVKSVLE